jgi:uncharacterized spore protein YtfJ
MSNNVVDVLKGVVGELKEIAKSETVVGQPIQVGKRTVIPVVKISVGFGAGGGQGEEQEGGKPRTGFGGGGGGGARIEPIAFIIIDEKDASILTVGKHKWESVIEAIPGLAKKFGKWAQEFKTDDNGDTSTADESSDSSEENND